MSFPYTAEFLGKAFSYDTYREHINNQLANPADNEHEKKMYPYIQKNVVLMDLYDQTYKLSDTLITAFENAPATTWLVITEGWCGDAAFNVPMLAAIERAFPQKVSLKLFLRDSNLELMDANLTDGGRSIPKLVVLSEDLEEVGSWGPRPESLQTLMKLWKSEGLHLKEIIPKVKEWYDFDDTVSLQAELTLLINSYSAV